MNFSKSYIKKSLIRMSKEREIIAKINILKTKVNNELDSKKKEELKLKLKIEEYKLRLERKK